MNPLRILIVDDEPAIRSGVRKLLATIDDVSIAGECQNAGEAVSAIRRNQTDLVLLDIHLPDASGLDVVRSVGPERMPLVVFLTAYDEHAIEAFELNALDYLLKPFDEDRLQRALDRAKDRLSSVGQQQVIEQLEKLMADYRRRSRNGLWFGRRIIMSSFLRTRWTGSNRLITT